MLDVQDLHTFYGDSHVLQGVSLKVDSSECVAVLGRNGAGKTTTLRTIIGLTRATSGSVRFKGRELTGQPVYQNARAGIAYVPEERGIFPTVTVDEHLEMALHAVRNRPTRKSLHYIYGLFPRLKARRKALGGQLSGGEQQMLAIARALACGPDLLILDEPSEGLAPVIIETLRSVLAEVKSAGMPILLVEQNYQLATQLAERVYVLSQGRVQFAGRTAELIENEAVRRTYLSV
jgi:branched-chain amino acid transport system ATP-binding protein